MVVKFHKEKVHGKEFVMLSFAMDYTGKGESLQISPKSSKMVKIISASCPESCYLCYVLNWHTGLNARHNLESIAESCEWSCAVNVQRHLSIDF